MSYLRVGMFQPLTGCLELENVTDHRAVLFVVWWWWGWECSGPWHPVEGNGLWVVEWGVGGVNGGLSKVV